MSYSMGRPSSTTANVPSAAPTFAWRVSDDPIVDKVTSRGFDLNEGMVLLIGERIYHGSDCLHVLALLTSGGSILNRLSARLFRFRSIARYVYPTLRAGRHLALRLLGRARIRLNT